MITISPSDAMKQRYVMIKMIRAYAFEKARIQFLKKLKQQKTPA